MRVEVNGESREIEDGDGLTVELVRDSLGLTGTKLVCGGGVCGACTVHLDGRPVASCLLPVTALRGHALTTVEGVGPDHPFQRSLMAHDGLQCGFCTPGFVMAGAAFHDRWRVERPGERPSRDEAAAALSGHLCRCGAYEGIIAALRGACAGEFDGPGGAPPRVEAAAKVTGAARFTVDVTTPGMLHGLIVRSRRAHARVDRVDPPPGVAAAVDLLGVDRTVRYCGQPIVALAAGSPAAARAALLATAVTYTDLPAALDVDDPAAPVVYRDKPQRRAAPSSAEGAPPLPTRWHGNVRGPVTVSLRGRRAIRMLEAAAERGDAGYLTATFRTAPQVHTALEPHATLADWRPDGTLTLHVSTQVVAHLRDVVAGRWKLDAGRVRVIAEHVGGGFGAKTALTSDTVAAVELSRAAGTPVRVVLDRAEELVDGGSRPGTRTELRMLTDGRRLTALAIDTHADGGVSVGSMVAGLGAFGYGRGPRRLRDFDVITNLPPGYPFRGPGGAPYAWAVEQGIDELAHRRGEDPIALRRRLDGNPKRHALYDPAAALPLWRGRGAAASGTGRFRRGVGMAAANWFYFLDGDTRVELTVRNGGLVARCAVQDMGTGSRTVIASAVRAAFTGVDISVEIGHSDGPHGPKSGGSRTTTSVAPAATNAAQALRERLRSRVGGTAADATGVRTATGIRPWPDVLAGCDGERATGDRGRDRRGFLVPWLKMDHLRPGRGMSGAVHICEVEVDTLLGTTRVLRVWTGLAVGRIWAPRLARSQAEGSVIQGVSFALYEERTHDPNTGEILTANLEDYRIAGIGDTPEIDVHFHERGWEHVPGGGVGLGEVATIAVAAAVANAVRHATGWRPTEQPIRPDRLLQGLAR